VPDNPQLEPTAGGRLRLLAAPRLGVANGKTLHAPFELGHVRFVALDTPPATQHSGASGAWALRAPG